MMQPKSVNSLSSVVMVPLLKAVIMLDKYDRLTNVVVFLDTSTSCLMINPNILSPNHWQINHNFF